MYLVILLLVNYLEFWLDNLIKIIQALPLRNVTQVRGNVDVLMVSEMVIQKLVKSCYT